MKLSAGALAFTCALLWGGSVLVIGLVNLAVPSYGSGFLHAMSSVYPGFHASGTPTDVLVGASEGLLDGAVGGAVFALLYNTMVTRPIVQHRF